MKIAAIPSDRGGCGGYRIAFPYTALRDFGHQVEIVYDSYEDPLDALKKDERIADADMCMLQRVSTNYGLTFMEAWKQTGKKLSIDFDDMLHNLPSLNPCGAVFGNDRPATKIFERAVQLADVVTCSTKKLAEEYRRFRDDIVVCENVLLDEHVDAVAPLYVTGEPKTPGEIRIGFVGSTTHTGDVALLTKTFTKILEKYPHVRLLFMAQPPVLPQQLVKTRVLYHPGFAPDKSESAQDYMLRFYRGIVSCGLDIGVAPLEPHVFNHCKSTIKMLEYGIAGVPVVASNITPYRAYRDSGGPILLASDDREWFNRLSSLIEDAEARKQFAEDNLKYIRERCTMRTGIVKWEGVVNHGSAQPLTSI